MEKTKTKSEYEAVVVFSLKSSEDTTKELVEKFKNLISSSAELTLLKEWGKRRLVYPINKETDGYYVLFNFESDPDFPSELNRVLKITSGVLRFLITKGIIKPMPSSSPPKRPVRSQEELPLSPDSYESSTSLPPKEVDEEEAEETVAEA